MADPAIRQIGIMAGAANGPKQDQIDMIGSGEAQAEAKRKAFRTQNPEMAAFMDKAVTRERELAALEKIAANTEADRHSATMRSLLIDMREMFLHGLGKITHGVLGGDKSDDAYEARVQAFRDIQEAKPGTPHGSDF